MNPSPAYDELEFERLYSRLVHKKAGEFICVISNSTNHEAVFERVSKRFPPDSVQNIDFSRMKRPYQFSFALLHSMIQKEARVVFLSNFQLACGDLSDSEFFLRLNYSRDSLAGLPCKLVFMIPLYFKIQIARNASDFFSFFWFTADLSGSDRTGATDNTLDALLKKVTEPSAVDTSLLEFYKEKYDSLNNLDDNIAFDIVLHILQSNDTAGRLHSIEYKRFYNEFVRLLPQNERDDPAQLDRIASVFQYYGDYQQALEYYRKALAIRERVLGTDHPSTATTYNNIAGVYSDLGDYQQALEYQKKTQIIHDSEKK